jgi:hypothetical protein
MTSVRQATPERLDSVLNAAEHCSSLCRHVLQENELAAGLQNAPDLLESLELVIDRAQHRCRDDRIRGLIS